MRLQELINKLEEAKENVGKEADVDIVIYSNWTREDKVKASIVEYIPAFGKVRITGGYD